MRRYLVLALAAAAAALAACGNEAGGRLDSLSLDPAAGTRDVAFEDVGLELAVPSNFAVTSSEPPGVFRASFGDGFLSAFAYRRSEQLPAGRRELQRARERLGRAAKDREGRFRLIRSRTLRVAGEPAVELLGDQSISRVRLRTRSLHVYAGDAEYVIELAAPRPDFARLDRRVFGTIRRTLEVTGDVRRERGRSDRGG